MRTMQPADPNAILAFIEVVRHGGFRGAERALGVPRSTLSQRVAGLEEHLGARLLSRTTRSVTLTDIGASYHSEVAPAFDALRSAESVVRQLQAHPSGRLRLTTPIELGHEILGGVLSQYARLYPEVEVEVDLTDRVVNLVEEGVDLAIRVGPLSDSRLIIRRLSSPQQMGIYGSPDYFERHGTPLQPADLSNHRCLVMTGAQNATSWLFSVEGKKRRIGVKPHMMVNSFQVLRAVAVSGVGITALPSSYAAADERAGRLQRVLHAYSAPPRPSLVVYPSNRHIAPAVRAMVDLVVEYYRRASNT